LTIKEAYTLIEAGYEYVNEFTDKGIKSSENASSHTHDADRVCASGAGGGI